MLIPAPVNHRWQLANILNERKLLGTAVEIGTHRGDFSLDFRRVWQGKILYCVDPWSIPAGYEYQASFLPEGGRNRSEDYLAYVDKMRPWIQRGQVVTLRDLSVDAAPRFFRDSLDLVYIDGDHSLDAITMDLHTWWPKIQSGGILAGHDFICPGEKNGGWGKDIQKAVLDFAHYYTLDVYLITEADGLPWSFYLEK